MILKPIKYKLTACVLILGTTIASAQDLPQQACSVEQVLEMSQIITTHAEIEELSRQFMEASTRDERDRDLAMMFRNYKNRPPLMAAFIRNLKETAERYNNLKELDTKIEAEADAFDKRYFFTLYNDGPSYFEGMRLPIAASKEAMREHNKEQKRIQKLRDRRSYLQASLTSEIRGVLNEGTCTVEGGAYLVPKDTKFEIDVTKNGVVVKFNRNDVDPQSGPGSAYSVYKKKVDGNSGDRFDRGPQNFTQESAHEVEFFIPFDRKESVTMQSSVSRTADWGYAVVGGARVVTEYTYDKVGDPESMRVVDFSADAGYASLHNSFIDLDPKGTTHKRVIKLQIHADEQVAAGEAPMVYSDDRSTRTRAEIWAEIERLNTELKTKQDSFCSRYQEFASALPSDWGKSSEAGKKALAKLIKADVVVDGPSGNGRAGGRAK